MWAYLYSAIRISGVSLSIFVIPRIDVLISSAVRRPSETALSITHSSPSRIFRESHLESVFTLFPVVSCYAIAFFTVSISFLFRTYTGRTFESRVDAIKPLSMVIPFLSARSIMLSRIRTGAFISRSCVVR